MDKYKRLLSNTVIFAIGTFSSKVLVFLLMPLYTWALSSAEFGTGDLIIQTGNLLIPLVTLGIVNAIIRFGLDKSVKKADVLSTGLITIIGGYLLFLAFIPLIRMISVISGYTLLVYIFVLTSTLRSLFSQFVRARGYVRLYALDGIISTVTMLLFNILFLVPCQMGVTGYVLAVICSDALSILFLFISASLWKYIKFQGISRRTAVEMLKYSIPLIPNMICWWITNSSDKFIVAYMIGDGANGLLSAAYKIPSIIVIVSTIFSDAWQMSAITEEKNRGTFFTKVFRTYGAIIFMAASGIILCSRLLMSILTIVAQDTNYDTAWMYIPFLIMATVFSCFVTFLGSVYTVEKKSVLSLLTMLSGAVVNIGLNILLIPYWGVNGATFATFVGYLLVFVIRAINTKKYIQMNLGVVKIGINTLILGAQSLILIMELPYWLIYEIALTLFMLVLNLREIIDNIKKLLSRR